MTILRPGDPSPPIKQYPVFSRSGWEIPQADPVDLSEWMPKQKVELVRIRTDSLVVERAKRDRSPIRIRSVSPFLYDCVGMIFASRRAYIPIDHIYDILEQDGYRRINPVEAVVGDIVLYKRYGEPSHVALIVDTDNKIGEGLNFRVLSKWGLDAELEHLAGNVNDNLGQPVEFYTERQL